MRVKNVVKVMNFHSLLRVDNARKLARKYEKMEAEITDMIDNILNNRNIRLDTSILRVKKKNPVMNIYIGSDYGFCSNFNSLINNLLLADENSCKILVGKKLKKVEDNVLFRMTREEFQQDNREILDYIQQEVKRFHYSQVNIIYNHYHNATDISVESKCIYPIPLSRNNRNKYKDDFVCETDMDELLVNLVTTYVRYEVEIAAASSYAAENVFRQNTTTQSIKKIEEREEEIAMVERRVDKEKQFKKTLESFTKINWY